MKILSLGICITLTLNVSAALASLMIDSETLIELVKSKNITSVDQLLKELPPGLRRNFVLIYNSRNQAQFASETQPRVILFSNDGRFQMTFAANQEVKGGNTVEMISQQANGEYKFASLEFGSDGPRLHTDGKNCRACHGMKPRPIWEGYSKWPGAYGSDHQLLRVGTQKGGYNSEERAFKEGPELKGLQSFRESDMKTGRYRFLEGAPTDDVLKLYPYLSNANMHFSETLLSSSNRNLVGELLKEEKFEKYLPWLVEKLNKPDMEFYLTDAEVKSFPDGPGIKAELEELNRLKNKKWAAVSNDIKGRIMALNPGIYQHLSMFNQGAMDHDGYNLLQKIGDRIGVDPKLWQPGIQGHMIQAGGAEPPLVNLQRELVRQMVARDPHFEKFVSYSYEGRQAIISDEGLKYISENRKKFIGSQDLVFAENVNRHINNPALQPSPEKSTLKSMLGGAKKAPAQLPATVSPAPAPASAPAAATGVPSAAKKSCVSRIFSALLRSK